MNGQRLRPGARLLRMLAAASIVVALALATGVLPVSAQEPAPVEQPPSATTTPETAPDDVQWGPIEDVPAPKRTGPRAPKPPRLREPAPPVSELEIPVPPPPPARGRDDCVVVWSPADASPPRPTPEKPCNKPLPEPESSPRHNADDRRDADGSPAVSNPGFVDALPGPSAVGGVPNFIIRKFRVPPFLLSIYQAAGIEYGIRWEVLAAINEIETDYGRNLNVSTAGALGWMQFMPQTWKAYGTDANKDGRKDPYNPVDAIFAAARYLKAAGYQNDVRQAIFAYNHADWYVDSVLLRARLIAGVPADLIGSLTGLTEGRFPVYARARYADAAKPRTRIHARAGAPVVAVNDGVITAIGRDYVVLQDVYGNRYAYRGLGSVARAYPVPRQDADEDMARAVRANPRDPRPAAAATAGTQRRPAPVPTQPAVSVKERLFANPDMPQARVSGGLEQLLDSKALKGKYTTYRNYFSRPFGLDASKVRLRSLKQGSRVIGGTILGHMDGPLRFAIRPAGRRAPTINPKPILDGWRLLEATAMRRGAGMSIGQILLLPKPALERRVLADERIDIYPGGRDDIRSGQIDRRVLATLEYLAESGLKPTVSSLRNGHSYLTASGNVSEHSSGNAVDIAAINDIPIIGHQETGGITDQAVRRLMLLQGTIYPHQIISLLDYGHNTLAMADHADHIHVGFQPLFTTTKHTKHTNTILKPGQWSDLIGRLGEIDNPVVPVTP